MTSIAIEAETPASEDALSQDLARIESALLDYRKAKGAGWRRESDASKRLSKALTRLINSRIGPDVEARIVLYPVMQKDKDDEERARLQDLEGKAKQGA